MGMGIGSGGAMNPFDIQRNQSPRGPSRRPHQLRGKWSTDSVDQELPIIEETKRIIENPASTIGADAGGSFKSKLKSGLEQLGWKLNRRATFKANFPFGSTYLVFDSTAALDTDERYKIEMVMGNSSVMDYKIKKWVYVETSAGGFELNFINILTNRWFLIGVALVVVGLLVFAFVSAFNDWGQPVE